MVINWSKLVQMVDQQDYHMVRLGSSWLTILVKLGRTWLTTSDKQQSATMCQKPPYASMFFVSIMMFHISS